MTDSLAAGEPPIPEPPPPVAAKPFPGFLAAIGLIVLVQIIANSVAFLVYAAGFAAQGNLRSVPHVDAAALGVVANSLAFGGVIWMAMKRSGRRAADVFPFSLVPAPTAGRPVRTGLLLASMVLMLGGALLTVSEITNMLVKVLPVPDFIVDLFSQFLTRGWTGFVFLVIVAPITEEFLFRGVLLRSFTDRYGEGPAILGTAALFGAIHLLPWQVVPAFFLGLVFAWWTLRCRSIVPALIGHAATNGISFFQSQNVSPEEVFTATPQPLAWTLAGIVALAVGFYTSKGLFSTPATGDHLERSFP